MTDEFLGYDRARVIELGRRTRAAIDFFDAISSDEPCAAGTIATIRGISHRVSTVWMPYFTTLVGDTSMLGWSSSGPARPTGRGTRGARSPAARTYDPSVPSDADLALAEIADQFDELDTNDDGELSWEEIAAGAGSDDGDLAAACQFLVDRPLAFVNTALAESNYSIGDVDNLSIDNLDDGGWDFDMDGDLALWQYMTLTPATIASAQEQNRHQRTLARPEVFAAADGAADGEIDGRVSERDLEALMEQSDDPEVDAMCRYFLDHPDVFERIDRESPDTGFDGTIAYDQLYALGLDQGALVGQRDPTIPDALRDLYGDAIDDDGDTQFLHVPIEPQPGRGQVVIALYIPTPTTGVTLAEDTPVLGDLLVSEGNARGPDPTAHPSDSKLHLIIDYETGLVTVRVPPSVGLDGGVSDALPIVTDMGDGERWLGRLTPAGDSNHVDISVDESGSIEMNVAILNADKRTVSPWLNGRYVISRADGDRVQLFWARDKFPAMEAYHISPDGEIVTLADDDADLGAVIGLLSDAGVSTGVNVG